MNANLGPWFVAGAAFVISLGAIVVSSLALAKVSSQATYVDSSEVIYSCTASNGEYDCVFTNASKATVATCIVGTITTKGQKAPKLDGTPICSGPLHPSETRSAQGKWMGGFAKDLCNSKGVLNTETLDWDKCDFRTDTFTAPSPR